MNNTQIYVKDVMTCCSCGETFHQCNKDVCPHCGSGDWIHDTAYDKEQQRIWQA